MTQGPSLLPPQGAHGAWWDRGVQYYDVPTAMVRSQGQPAPAAVTGVAVTAQAGQDRGEGPQGHAAPGGVPGIGAAPNTADVSPGGRPHSPDQPHSLVVGEVSRGQDSTQWVQGPGKRLPGSGGSSMHPDTPSGTLWAPEALGSAQALVQVGRGEEGVGSQAHGQEALDQGGAETTCPGSGPLGAAPGGGVHRTGG